MAGFGTWHRSNATHRGSICRPSGTTTCRTKVRADHYEALFALNIRHFRQTLQCPAASCRGRLTVMPLAACLKTCPFCDTAGRSELNCPMFSDRTGCKYCQLAELLEVSGEKPGHFWSARATHAAMPHLPVPPPCRRTTHFSDCTSSRLSPLASPLAQGRGSGGAENA
jgi:hypothetical protein